MKVILWFCTSAFKQIPEGYFNVTTKPETLNDNGYTITRVQHKCFIATPKQMKMISCNMSRPSCRQIFSINRNKTKNLNFFRLVLEFSLPNPLKLGLKSTGAAPTTSEWWIILLPTKARLISRVWWQLSPKEWKPVARWMETLCESLCISRRIECLKGERLHYMLSFILYKWEVLSHICRQINGNFKLHGDIDLGQHWFK